MSEYLIDYKLKKQRIENLLREMRRIKHELSKLLSTPAWFDYEEFVKERSLKLFGEVKEFYSPSQVAKLLGVDERSVRYRIERGHIVAVGGKISFEQVVILAEYYRCKEELRRFADEYRKRFKSNNSEN